MTETVLVNGARTPIGKLPGGHASLSGGGQGDALILRVV